MKILAGNSNRALTEAIAAYIGVPLTKCQVRRFADTARLPVSPLWPMVTDMTDRTVAAWENLDEKSLMPEDMCKAIGEQIMTVAKSVSQAITK